MKKKWVVLLLLTCVGCMPTQKKKHSDSVISMSDLLGIWQNQDHYLVIHPSSIQLRIGKNLMPLTQTLTGNQLIVEAETLSKSCLDEMQKPIQGKYDLKLNGHQLLITEDSDECSDRKEPLEGTWNFVENPWKKIVPSPGSLDFTIKNHPSKHFDYSPLCSDGTPFSFYIRENNPKHLTLYFEGGGACWNSTNCIVLPSYTAQISDDQEQQLFFETNGAFDFENPESPFGDSTVIWIPYCSADIFWGSTQQSYTEPSNGKQKQITHHGFDNFLSVVKKLQQQNQEEPFERLWVTGFSAGGFGASLNAPYLQEAFPEVPLVVFNDSANGIIKDDFLQKVIEGWKAGEHLPDWIPGLSAAEFHQRTLADFYSRVSAYYPNMAFAQYSSVYDATQTLFFQQTLTEENVLLWLNPPESTRCQWNQKLLGFDQQGVSQIPKYQSFLAPGEEHGILKKASLYTLTVEGHRVVDWLTRFLNKTSSATSVHCKDCDTPKNLVCP